MSGLITPEQLDHLNDTMTGEELFNCQEIKTLRMVIAQDVSIAESYQPQFDAVVDAIDDYRNNMFRKAGGL